MKDKLKKALGQIALPPELDSDVRKGVDRALAERRCISMTKNARSVWRIAAAAAAFVIVAAVGFGLYSFTKSPTDDVAGLKFMGYKTGTTEPVVVEVSKEGKIIGKVETDEVVLKDENGVKVEQDGIVMMMTYWLDENEDLQCTDIPFGTYLVESTDDAKTYKLDGFNSEDFGDRVTLSPTQSSLNSVEDGTAYDVGEGELEISLEKTADGTLNFVFEASDSSKYPYSEISEYHLDSVMAFDRSPKWLGTSYGYDGAEGISSFATNDPVTLLGGSLPSGAGSIMKIADKCGGEECFWEINRDDNTLKITGAESEIKGWVKLSTLQAKMSDGRSLELRGNWILKVEC